MDLTSLLKNHFGYDAFRPLQKEIIDHVIRGDDAFVLMPTGGGKSLCYQLPALALDGLTLVISPLIALMKDQVDALKANGIPAAFINSSLSEEEIRKTKKEIEAGKIKILYVAPERLATPSFKNFLENANVRLVAIDEAHCISEWGHDFRPEYRNLKTLREYLPKVPVIALTATATKKVQEDILNQLNLKNGKVFISSFNRPNLTYRVEPKQQTFEALVSLLTKHAGEPTIIYCFSRKGTEQLVKKLKEKKIAALPYHAGLAGEIRMRNQEKFIRDEVPVIVATIAFGMGINKPDIRLVVHYDLPKSVEGYYQETGRAGRDGLESECVLFYSYGDVVKHNFFIEGVADPVEQKRTRENILRMVEYCERRSCRRAFLLRYFGEQWEAEKCEACDACLNQGTEAKNEEREDATIITQKVLSTVIRTGERFGIQHIADVLRGSGTEKIVRLQHHTLRVFGISKEVPKKELLRVVNLLIKEGLLEKNEGQYPTLFLTTKGKKFLKEKQSIELPKAPKEIPKSAPRKEKPITQDQKDEEYDQALFEKLRTLRKKLATEQGVPPFIIFGDKTLRAMSREAPQTLEAMSEIFGIGAQKLKQLGKIFLSEIQNYSEEKQSKENTKSLL